MHTKLSDIERQRVRIALVEDAGKGDPTTLATIDEGREGTGLFLSKGSGVIAGLDIARQTFEIFEQQQGLQSPIFDFDAFVNDGDKVEPGLKLATIRADLRTLLTAERVALNLLQRISGIASMTADYVSAVEGTGAIILDTRKTAPLLRPFDRYGVRAGGGTNHRYSLTEMILVKDNHIAANDGDLSKVLDKLRDYFTNNARIPVEIEVTSMEQIELLMKIGQDIVQRILLDNFPLAMLSEGIKIIGSAFETEASGGVTLATVRSIAERGVNFISVGALTHSVTALDISLEIEPA